ncbi:prepilin-type N-terminal cleavage/methylation domain-containing protein [Candidatus Saccharibacteria bacterium]|nr:prepilin-type N-terminal cleavage/methylation domain-containing protein [Candidatus Saccharibacteria bacterium]
MELKLMKNIQSRGFTIVELLIVIVVIAILAAITIVAYNGIQNRANDTAVQSDLRTLRTKIEMYKAENDLYPAGANSVAELEAFNFKASKKSYATSPTTEGNLWYCRNSGRIRYAVVALSISGNIYYITHNSGPQQYTGATSWNPTGINCNSIVNSEMGWQQAGYSQTDTSTGPWRSWAGGN